MQFLLLPVFLLTLYDAMNYTINDYITEDATSDAIDEDTKWDLSGTVQACFFLQIRGKPK